MQLKHKSAFNLDLQNITTCTGLLQEILRNSFDALL